MASTSEKRKTHIDLATLETDKPLSFGASDVPDQQPSFWRRAVPRNHNSDPRPLKRKKAIAPAIAPEGLQESQSAPVEFQLPKAVEAGVRAFEYVETQRESPMKKFHRVFELEFDDFQSIAARKAFPHELVTIKKIATKEHLDILQQTRHPNFVRFLEAFQTEERSYAILEYEPISLTQIIASPPYPTETQLAAILAQVLNGLIYLGSKDLAYNSLGCSNILLSADGVVKITDLWNCSRLSPSGGHIAGVRAVGHIAMELMQKYAKDDGVIGVENLDRWPLGSKAVDFLSQTTSAQSYGNLLDHPLVQLSSSREELRWIVELAGISVHRGYTYVFN